MKLARDCPFCGESEVDLKVAGNSSVEGISMVVQCIICGAATSPVFCATDDYTPVLREWKEGTIYSSYIKRIKDV